VAEHLTKNGIEALALHGNKSQTARTQALQGFKDGTIRALVATDIAARGIDIDELPHVVNYEIPNVSEDYVHRIGRTGRAGNSGEAVSLVCLDEEGFMQDIERFTKQNIEVKVIEGFGPEPGEKGEPIAMGRQTIWGGAGKPPSRDVMQAAAKAARTEMLQRVRDNKAGQGGGTGGGSGRGGQAAPRGRSAGGGGYGGGNSSGNGGGQGRDRNSNSGEFQPPRPQGQGRGRPGGGMGQPAGFASEPRAPRAPAGQPDPMRTSVDMMAERGARRGGNFGGGNRNGGGGGGGFGSARSGGGGRPEGGFGRGGNGPRGPRSGGSGGSSSR
jgi:ATP-dependent RNA helicase RhlE